MGGYQKESAFQVGSGKHGNRTITQGVRHGLERDAAGRLTAKTTPETRTEYRYDAADRLLAVRRGGEPAGQAAGRDRAGGCRQRGAVQPDNVIPWAALPLR
ncbi:RHS repeat protein [Salmonella enterica subsp. enterica serovar Miami]|nr:RHS repeat protein [Salmonella enterica subsp. enterica serovar Miami]